MRRTLMTIDLAMSRFSVLLSGYATALGNGVRWWGGGWHEVNSMGNQLFSLAQIHIWAQRARRVYEQGV